MPESRVEIPSGRHFELWDGIFTYALLFSTGNGGEAVLAWFSLARKRISKSPDQLET
jgi:hypothetical protein